MVYWCSVLCSMIHGTVVCRDTQRSGVMCSVVSELDGCQDLDRQLELEFIIQQLLHLFSCMDLTDQACR